MKLNKYHFLVLIFLIVLAFNLYINLSLKCFAEPESYFNIRVIEHIKNTLKPLTFDPLSYSGINLIPLQLFHYLIAIFSFIPLYLDIIPAILSSSIIFVAYLISKEITKDETTSLLVSLLSGFVPIYFIKTSNNVSVYSFAVPFLFLLFYFLMKIETKGYLKLFLFFSFLLPFIGAPSFLFILSMLFYAVLNISEGLNISKIKKEAILFSFFFVLFVNLILFKKAFLMHGFGVIFGNVPDKILATYFSSFNIFTSIYFIGIISFFLGIIGVYFGIKERKDLVILFVGLILSVFLLLFLKLINLDIGLMFLGVSLSIISSLPISKLFAYVNKTKLYKIRHYFIVLFLGLIFVFAVLPCYSNIKKCDVLINDFYWMGDNLKENSVVLAPLEYGHYITGISNEGNVIDSNFLLAKEVNDRFDNIKIIYNTWSETKALELLHEYDVDYIYIDKATEYNLIYLEDEKCFEKIRERIYYVKC